MRVRRSVVDLVCGGSVINGLPYHVFMLLHFSTQPPESLNSDHYLLNSRRKYALKLIVLKFTALKKATTRTTYKIEIETRNNVRDHSRYDVHDHLEELHT